MGQGARQRYTFDQYLALEAVSPIKHEFLGGAVWAMAGGSAEHSAIAVNIAAFLSTALRGRPCRVFNSDLRIRVRATGLGTYPDISVVCDQLEYDPEDRTKATVVNPTLIVEVPSPSTAEYDRGEKLDHYRQIPSLREIVLVESTQRKVAVWTRIADEWRSRDFDGSAAIAVESLGVEIPMDEVYRDPLG